MPEPLVNSSNAFVFRIAPRSHRRERPRGTLIDPQVDLDQIDLMADYIDYYRQTFGADVIPDHILLDFGQPPIDQGQLIVQETDLAVLLVGSDNPDGSANPRGICGLGLVEDALLRGSGNSARCSIKIRVVVRLASILGIDDIKNSKFYEQSGISDIGIFGFDHAPQAHNCVRFYLNSDDEQQRKERMGYLLDMFNEVDATIKRQLEENLPELIELLSEPTDSEDLSNLVIEATEAFNRAGLHISESDVRRFCAALKTKPFVILSGLSGSGKTKLAQAFAYWVTSLERQKADPFIPGSKITADRVEYVVVASDSVAVTFERPETGTKATLPRELIAEWATTMEDNGLNATTPVRQIRDIVERTTKYSGQINSFESHLKAAALALIESRSRSVNHKNCHYLAAVGADWTNNENILGYPDALNPQRYETTPILDLACRAEDQPAQPYFLILDEMNLSHVERYFSDILSAMESETEIFLYEEAELENYGVATRSGIPPRIKKLPANLYIVGTINVDETTYLFSPKVLDRANVIEFRVKKEDMKEYLRSPKKIDLEIISGRGAKYASHFVQSTPNPLDTKSTNMAREELLLFFEVLSDQWAEFGFRTANEVIIFLAWHKQLTPSEWEFRSAFDAQILQKILPKLHGSLRKMGPILYSLGTICFLEREWTDLGEIINKSKLIDAAAEAARVARYDFEVPENILDGNRPLGEPYYFESFVKIQRMMDQLRRNSFVSFAEA